MGLKLDIAIPGIVNYNFLISNLVSVFESLALLVRYGNFVRNLPIAHWAFTIGCHRDIFLKLYDISVIIFSL